MASAKSSQQSSHLQVPVPRPLSAPCRPVSVVLLGHSYIRRLQDFMDRNPECRNLTQSTQDAVVHTFGRGGATLRLQPDDHWINCHLQPALVCHPSVLFLHVGENDLEALTSPEIADHLWALVNYIISLSHPRAIIISQLLWFPKYEDRHQQITSVNSKLQEFVNVYQPTCVSDRPPTRVEVLHHKFGVGGENRQANFLSDRTHLTEHAMRKYFYSVRNSIGKHLQNLLSQ